MSTYGYARISTNGQDLTSQDAELAAAGCAKIYREKVSGAKTDRAELAKVINRLEAGDVLVAPSGTPQPIVERLAQVMAQMAKDLEIQKKMEDFGSTPFANTPKEYAEMLREETARWEKALSAIGIKKKQ